ncbi:MAG TPA: hypothetical protein VK993_16265 [Chthoniobacterales bacterium]|nr:hypothetical protein [Chthoniobacterales bacterium]
MATFEISARASLLVAAAVVLTKLWLVHSEEICGSATRYDAFWFVNSAKDWYWGAAYSWTAFVRPPSYPLWLGLVHEIGLRQRLAIEVLQLSGYALLVLGLRRAGASRAVCAAGFAAACFHPGSFQLNNYTMADPFYAAVLSITVGAMILTMATARRAVALATGVALAVLWFTREESVLIVLLVLGFCGIWLLRERTAVESWRAAARRVFVPCILLVGTLAALVLTVYSVNERTFRAFGRSEMSSPSYDRALEALIRIKPPSFGRYVPVTTESLNLAFAASQTFARLKPHFDAGVGEGWRTETLNQQGVRGEIGINYLMWALRNAAAEARIHADAKKAEKFYNRMAREINAACDARRVPSRIVWASFIGPNLLPNAHRLPRSLADMLRVFVLRYETAPLKDDEILLPEERAIYDDITRRRSLEAVRAASAPVATAVKNAIGWGHRFFVMALAGGALVALAAAVRRGRRASMRPLDAALLLIFLAIVSRVGLFTVIDATSWPVAYERFLFPVMPMTTVFLLAVIGEAVRPARDEAARS